MSAPLDKLWDDLWEDLRHNATGRPSGAAIIALRRGAIEAAARRELVGSLEDALEALAAAGHIVTKRGYCARCEGGCVISLTKPSPEVRLVEPSPFGARP